MKPTSIFLIVLIAGWAAQASGQYPFLVIENESVVARWTQETGELSLISKPSGTMFVKGARLGTENSGAEITSINHKTFGPGKAIEVSCRCTNAYGAVVMLFPKLPFVLLRNRLHNYSAAVSVTKQVQTFSALCEPGKPGAQLITLGTGGLLPADKNPGSYAWLAVAEPQTRNGVVFGWLTHNRGSGVVFTQAEGNAVQVKAQIDYGRLRIAPGRSEELETLAVGYFADARLGLEAWADAVAKVYDIHLPPQPVGYCTWYSQPHGGAADEKHLSELAGFSATNLAPFGFSAMQIDDGWQAGFKRTSPSSPKKDFRTHNPSGPYPSGMKTAADNIKSFGLVPGIWFMPFAGTATDPFFTNHLDWFVKTAGGEPFDTPWGGACLDMTHSGARAHLREITSRICRDWGFQYIKIDGLWTGTATRQTYVNSGYKDDRIGEAVFQNPEKTNIEAYRDGLRLVREAAGENVFILGCNGPQNMRSYGGAFGLVDAMRVGPDNGADWKRLTRGTIFGSRHYFLHGRVWYNDPDPVYVRANMPLNHAQLICSWVALSGQLNLSSEWLPGLPPERLDILKRSMPAHGLLPRPVDIFESDPPRIWLLTDAPERGVHAASTSERPGIQSQMNRAGSSKLKRPEGRAPRRDVIGLFNWESKEHQFDYPIHQLGLDVNTEYAAFDYWQNTLVPAVKGRLQISVPAESCRVIAVRPRADHPQILSTSRHITQGIVDVVEEKWDARNKTLSGRSRIVGGDPYELRFATEVGGKVFAGDSIRVSATDKSAGVKAALTSDGKLVRAKIESPTSREVSWTTKFK